MHCVVIGTETNQGEIKLPYWPYEVFLWTWLKKYKDKFIYFKWIVEGLPMS